MKTWQRAYIARFHISMRGLTLIPAWISNHIRYKVWDEITYPFLNFNGVFHPILYKVCNYLSMLGLKLNHVSKRGPSIFNKLNLTTSYTLIVLLGLVWF